MPTEQQNALSDTLLELGWQVPPDDSPIWRRGSVVRFGQHYCDLIRAQKEGRISHSSPNGVREDPEKEGK